jgi:hypothetical protein
VLKELIDAWVKVKNFEIPEIFSLGFLRYLRTKI